MTTSETELREQLWARFTDVSVTFTHQAAQGRHAAIIRGTRRHE